MYAVLAVSADVEVPATALDGARMPGRPSKEPSEVTTSAPVGSRRKPPCIVLAIRHHQSSVGIAQEAGPPSGSGLVERDGPLPRRGVDDEAALPDLVSGKSH